MFFIFVCTNVVMTNEKINRDLVVGLLRIGNQLNDALNLLVKRHGISLPQFNVLRILRGQKGTPANLSTINKRMIHKMSNTTRLIDKLMDKQLVNRKICESNRRKIEIEITDKGLELLSQLDEKITKKEAQLTANLNEKEKEKLIALVQHLIQSTT